MNERIRELAEQAKLKTELWNNPEPFVIYKEDVNYPGGLEKFAELIVRECIEQASIGNGHGNNQWDRALTFAAKNIKEHFGVER
jgi:hypothetical protein